MLRVLAQTLHERIVIRLGDYLALITLPAHIQLGRGAILHAANIGRPRTHVKGPIHRQGAVIDQVRVEFAARHVRLIALEYLYIAAT